jgi:hypothetical protein
LATKFPVIPSSHIVGELAKSPFMTSTPQTGVASQEPPKLGTTAINVRRMALVTFGSTHAALIKAAVLNSRKLSILRIAGMQCLLSAMHTSRTSPPSSNLRVSHGSGIVFYNAQADIAFVVIFKFELELLEFSLNTLVKPEEEVLEHWREGFRMPTSENFPFRDLELRRANSRIMVHSIRD